MTRPARAARDVPTPGTVVPNPGTPLVLVVPMPEIATNRRHGKSRHWRAIERDKTDYWQRLDGWAMAHRAMRRSNAFAGVATAEHPWDIPDPPAEPFGRVTLTSHMTLWGAMDDDNAVARHKWLVDWLVRRGYLVSDRRTCARWAAFPTQTVTRKQPARITLTITPETT